MSKQKMKSLIPFKATLGLSLVLLAMNALAQQGTLPDNPFARMPVLRYDDSVNADVPPPQPQTPAPTVQAPAAVTPPAALAPAPAGTAPGARVATPAAPAAAPAPAVIPGADKKAKKGKGAVAPAPQPAPVVAAPVAAPTPVAQPTPEPVLTRTAAAGLKVKKPAEVNDAPVAGVTLKFDNADIYEVVQAVLGDILHLNYLVDPSIQGKLTLNTNGTVSSADVYGILESVLQLNNLSIIRDGKLYKVVRDPNAPKDMISFEAAGENSPMIEIIPMQFVQAGAVLNVLRNFIGPQAGIVNDTTNRYLIVADRAANIAKLKEMLKTLDVDYLQKVRIRVVQIQKGDAVEMAKEMDGLFKTSGLFNWPGTDGNKIFFMPIVRMNALLVAGANEPILDAAEQWIKRLDDEPKDGVGAGIHVYPIANSNALHVANILRQLYGGSPVASATPVTSNPNAPTQTINRGATPVAGAATTASGTGLSGAVQIIPDEATNTLVIKANQQDYLQIKKVIERIDTIPRQVMIQVMVAEVSLTDKLQYGVEWWLKSQKFGYRNKTWAGQAGLDTGLVAPTTNPVVTAPAAGVGSGFNYSIFNGAGDVVGLLNLLATDTNVNVLSAPHVMASDGKAAKIEVGGEVPVITQTVSSTATTATGLSTSNSVQYRPTGILLEVKPNINASGLVTLNISQEVSGQGAQVTAGGSTYPSFTKRKVSTDVTIEEGKTLVVAGLIQDSNTKDETGLPGVKDIPILGTLFGSTSKKREKTELLVAVTPYIVRNRAEGDKISADFMETMDKLSGVMKKAPLYNFPEKANTIRAERAAKEERDRKAPPVDQTGNPTSILEDVRKM